MSTTEKQAVYIYIPFTCLELNKRGVFNYGPGCVLEA